MVKLLLKNRRMVLVFWVKEITIFGADFTNMHRWKSGTSLVSCKSIGHVRRCTLKNKQDSRVDLSTMKSSHLQIFPAKQSSMFAKRFVSSLIGWISMRTQQANSVGFSHKTGGFSAAWWKVPINVYPVTWSSLPDSDWPEQCDDTETQGERAFDPFVPCLGLGEKKRLPAFCCKCVVWGGWIIDD